MQSYKKEAYYGAYPPNYLRRVLAMFPDAERILHLFSGSLPLNSTYARFDVQGSTNHRFRVASMFRKL